MVRLSRKSPHRRLIGLQKQIYLSLQDESRRLLGEMPRSIQKYGDEFHSDFRKLAVSYSPVSQSQLIREVLRTPVTLVGDFHTFFQAQRTALRILRSAVLAGPRYDWLLGLELVGSQHQKSLDRYCSGKISLTKLLETIRYDDEWGFPWRHYAQILEWAKENRVRLIALNRPKELIHFWDRKDEDLSLRDSWAAGVITDLFARKSKSLRMIALYGELHLGRKHLPAQIEKISRNFKGQILTPIVIHQNQDLLYWKLAQNGREFKTQILKLNDQRSFCVISTTPWTKLQSLVSWAENPEAHHEAPEDEFQTDYLDLIQRDGRLICKFLDLYPPPFESVNVKTWDNLDFLESTSKLSSSDKRRFRFFLRNNWRVYIPKLETAYLASAGDNAAAETAAFLIFHNRYPRSPTKLPLSEEYAKATLEHAFGFFGSMILNPRRKCDLPEDHQERITARVKLTYPTEKTAREHCLRALSALTHHKAVPLQKSGKPISVEIWAPSARYLGQFLGRAIYFATLVDGSARSRLSLDEVKETLLAPRTVASNFFSTQLGLLMERLPRLPSGSKEEVF